MDSKNSENSQRGMKELDQQMTARLFARFVMKTSQMQLSFLVATTSLASSVLRDALHALFAGLQSMIS
jgi:hypothetical protein